MTPAEALAELRAMHTPPLGVPCRWCQVGAPCPTLEVIDDAIDPLPDGAKVTHWFTVPQPIDGEGWDVVAGFSCDNAEAMRSLRLALGVDQ
jgi:hypothetical protein